MWEPPLGAAATKKARGCSFQAVAKWQTHTIQAQGAVKGPKQASNGNYSTIPINSKLTISDNKQKQVQNSKY